MQRPPRIQIRGAALGCGDRKTPSCGHRRTIIAAISIVLFGSAVALQRGNAATIVYWVR